MRGVPEPYPERPPDRALSVPWRLGYSTTLAVAPHACFLSLALKWVAQVVLSSPLRATGATAPIPPLLARLDVSAVKNVLGWRA